MTGTKHPEMSNSVENMSMSLDECRDARLRNCSRSAYASSEEGIGCIMWAGDLIKLRRYTNGGYLGTTRISYHHEATTGKVLEVPSFELFAIASATENFAITNKIGEGGFGPVYKGMLFEREVAVKRLSRSSGQGLKEFKSEIQLVEKLQHTNLVRLLGCCIEAEERILIYEYMPNGSLDKYIFDSTRGALLDWHRRLHIIEGITQGLLYLHKFS